MLEQAECSERLPPVESLGQIQGNMPIPEPPFVVSRMVAHICHDLRHPLAAILANAEFLTESDIDETERKNLYQEISSAVDWMNGMITSLLDNSRNAETLRLAAQNVAATVERVIGMTSVRQKFRQVSITHRHEGLTQGCFDASRLERALANLILNACEAVSPVSGQIVITTVLKRTCLHLGVWDNGPGIPEEIQESMFLPFVSYGKTNGHGLGLAIAKTLIMQHGGEIYFDENCDTGTQFVVLIPLAASAGTVPICH